MPQPTKSSEDEPGMYPPVKPLPNSPTPTVPFDLYNHLDTSDPEPSIELDPDDDEPLTDLVWGEWVDDFFRPRTGVVAGPYDLSEEEYIYDPEERAIEIELDKKPGE